MCILWDTEKGNETRIFLKDEFQRRNVWSNKGGENLHPTNTPKADSLKKKIYMIHGHIKYLLHRSIMDKNSQEKKQRLPMKKCISSSKGNTQGLLIHTS